MPSNVLPNPALQTTQLAPSAFWQEVVESRLHALPGSLSARALLEEIDMSKRAHESLKAKLEHRIKVVTGRHLPPEILAFVFTDLARMEPLGELEEGSELSVHTGSASPMNSDWSYDPDAAQHGSLPLGSFLDAKFEPEEVVYSPDEASQFGEASTESWCQYSLGWTRVTHVCTWWRALAISMPNLWCTIPFNLSTPWIKTLLARSERRPLDIVLDEDAAMDKPRERLVEAALMRARSLDFRHISPTILALVVKSISGSRRTLEDLSVFAPLRNAFQAQLLQLSDYRALTSITIENFDRFPEALAPGLKQLSLTSCRMRPSSSELLTFLRGLANIEILELRYCLPPQVDEFQSSQNNRIPLPALQALTLEQSSSSLWGNLIHHLSYPISTRVEVSYMAQPTLNLKEYFGEALQSLVVHKTYQHFALDRILSSDLDTSPIRTLSISSTGGDSEVLRLILSVHGWRHSTAMAHGRPTYYLRDTLPSVRPDVFCELHDEDSRHTQPVHRRIVRALVEAVSLEHICVLSLDLEKILSSGEQIIERWTPDAWVSLFASARCVEHVRVVSSAEESAAVDMLLALGRTSDADSSFDLFPALQTLEICDTIPATKDSKGEVQATDALRALLSARRAKLAGAKTILRVYLVLQHQPLPDTSTRRLIRQGLPVRWEDVDWVSDDEDVILEDMRVVYEYYD